KAESGEEVRAQLQRVGAVAGRPAAALDQPGNIAEGGHQPRAPSGREFHGMIVFFWKDVIPACYIASPRYDSNRGGIRQNSPLKLDQEGVAEGLAQGAVGRPRQIEPPVPP